MSTYVPARMPAGRLAWLCGTLACVLSACAVHAPEAPSPRVVARLPLRVFDMTASGVHIATLPRATPGVVRLALYVDAGSRDSVLPQTATLAAWLAAGLADAPGSIETTIFPDTTELSITCPADEMPRCVGQLARAIALRDPSEQALSEARLRLREGQRRALAQAPYEAVDRRALHALIGDVSRNFFPLGSADDDLAAAGDAVPVFLRDHYGPKRSLVVAAGDVDPSRVREAVSEAFAGSPLALALRAPRTLEPHADPQLEAAADNRAAAAIALEGDSVSALRDSVQQLSAALDSVEPRVQVTGHVFPVRTGALSLLHLEASDPELALERATRELARLQHELNPAPSVVIQDDDLAASSRELGLGFGTDGPVIPHVFRFAAGLSLSAGYDPGPAARAQQRESEDARLKRAASTWQRALSVAEPKLIGDIDDEVAAVTLDNGAHIDVQFTRGETVAVALRIGLGADQDSPLLHGQAAWLSTLTNLACAGMGSELRHNRFASLGATIETRVDSESYGMLLRVPKEHFAQAVDLAMRCLRAPSREPHDLVAAGVLLQQRLRTAGSAFILRARAANLVAPRAPGALAPWGDPDRVANFSTRELDQIVPGLQYGQRWSVAVVGPVDVRTSVSLIARRLADLASNAPKSSRWTEPAAVLPNELPHSRDANGVKLLALWTVRGSFEDALGAKLYARALAAMLGAMPGIDVLSYDADTYKDTSFAAIGLRLRPDVTSALPALLAGAAHSIDNAWLERALGPALEDAVTRDNAHLAQFATRAERIARARLGARFDPPRLDHATHQLQGLRDSKPGFAPMP